MSAGTPNPLTAAPPDVEAPLPNDPIDERLIASGALNPKESIFDYVIVGSGAGGGPLAARLALAGKKVLVIEAGCDPIAAESRTYKAAGTGEVTRVPGYYAAASEDAEMSWMFSVRHYADDERQARDEKYNRYCDPVAGGEIPEKYRDPHPRPQQGKNDTISGRQGIFYPRSSGIGGCTAHHAMITIAPNDKDWNYIADLTGDDSWRPGAMRGYFAKFERNQYIDAYNQFLGRLLGFFYKVYRWLNLFFDPRAVLDEGGHGRNGWAPTNFIDPNLIFGIAKTDKAFIRVIIRAALGVLHSDKPLIAALKRALLTARAVPAIDFNDINTRRSNPEGVFLIPIGVEGKGEPNDKKEPGTGTRFGVREFLLRTQFQHPDRLLIKTRAHVTRVLFEKGKDGVPRAIGVECAVGQYLYEASPLQQTPPKERVCYFAKANRGEIILCGGAFNTPQLLMLSGIGEQKHLADKGITHLFGVEETDGVWTAKERTDLPLIELPGVGRNLQDRYEVTIVTELDRDLKTLENVSFLPGDPNDPARRQWIEEKKGLYGSNGGTLAVIRRSQPVQDAGEPEPDLFTFGAPAAFRGYYWNWSREVFKPGIGGDKDAHNLWSWVILKAYTSNDKGSVRLRTDCAFDAPEICFDAFNEAREKHRRELDRKLEEAVAECERLARAGQPQPAALTDCRKRLEAERDESDRILAGSKRDLAALVDAVAFMRKVNARNPDQLVREIQPGSAIPDYSPAMEEWVRTQAWGHHCSCTCRLGSDTWQADTRNLVDKKAVLDSRFKVHGATNLRIVDASIFPKIPGYFILAPIFMVSEKAADTLIEDSRNEVYPASFAAAEAEAIHARRKLAHPATAAENADADLPEKTIGLALSGGGIRSATFALGVLQSLAAKNRLRDIDFLSTVSGGGFIGGFLGRLFTRDVVKNSKDPCGRVQDIVKDTNSAPLWWLRTQANYIFATGQNDLQQNLAIFWRNIFAVHLVIGALLFTVFGLLAWLPGFVGGAMDSLGLFPLRALLEPVFAPPVIRGLKLSPWWFLPVAVLGAGVLPATLGYWLAPKVGSYRPYPLFSLLAWLVLLAGVLVALQIPGGMLLTAGAGLVLLLSWLWQEAARWGAVQGDGPAEAEQAGLVVRNRLVYTLAELTGIFVLLAAWVVLDTFAAMFGKLPIAAALTSVMVALGPLLPLLRMLALKAQRQLSSGKKGGFSPMRTAQILGVPLGIVLLGVVDVLAHRLFNIYPGWSWGLLIIAITGAFSLALGRAFDFLNLSSLHTTYAVRLARTFQGASNEERVYSASDNEAKDIRLAHPKDDIPFDQYHPERQGGPLHLINVCVNETVEFASGRDVRERKGLPMCVSPHGVSVGRRYFAEWTQPDNRPFWQRLQRWIAGTDAEYDKPVEKRRLTALRALPASVDPNAFHVLKTKDSESAEVESLSLGAWIAISGAAFTTGIGRGTKLGLSLFLGLANVRLGYWWDSGIREQDRPGRYPLPFLRKLKRIPLTLFRMQSLLLSEWAARFHGATRWFWYLSDGGHFDVTGLYELLRRRVKFIILTDGGADPNYRWSDLGILTQQARLDFRAEIKWLTEFSQVPDWILAWINREAIGPITEIKRTGALHAALASVTYEPAKEPESWILLLKPGISDAISEDIRNYAAENPEFPQQPTFDQVFDDLQWESYRALGQKIAGDVLADP